MSYSDIKLVLPTFLYSLLLFSNDLYAMDPPPDFDENPNHESELFIENEILKSPDAESLRDLWNSLEYKYIEGELAKSLYKHINFAAHIVSIGNFLPGGMEGLLVVLVHLTRFNRLKPIIGKVMHQFTPDKFPNRKRSEIGKKLLSYLEDVCHMQRMSDKYQQICLSNYSAHEIVCNITMKMQDLLLKVSDQDVRDWLEDNNYKIFS